MPDLDTLIHGVGGSLVCVGLAVGAFLAIVTVWSAVSGRNRRGSERDFEDEYRRQPCANCGYDLRGATRRCPECGTLNFDRRVYLRRLREEVPADPIALRQPEVDERPELLIQTSDAGEAELLRENLMARGIACSLKTGVISGEVWTGRRRTVTYDVMVYTQDLEAAKTLLERMRAVPEEDD